MLNPNYMVDSASKGDFKYLFTMQTGYFATALLFVFLRVEVSSQNVKHKRYVTKLNIQYIKYVLDVVKRQGN